MTTTTRARRPAKPARGKTANRFANLAGGDSAADGDLSPISDSQRSTDSGLIGGMSAVAADEAHRVVQLRVAEIVGHPFNNHQRSQPQPGERKWEELLSAVKANGVRLPVLVVPRATFAAARPLVAEQIPADARYVLVYGHRRRAAALAAGRETIPAVVDEAIMAEDGDLDAMAAENLGREDLSDLAEADLYTRYAEMGLSQRAIGDRLGVDQATVSRRLALKLLAPEVCVSVDDGQLPSAEAAALAGKLPYGPQRPWQKNVDADQNSDGRRAEQIEAQRLVLEQNWSASRAAERVIAERHARAEAAAQGIALVADPRAELGEHYADHRVSRDDTLHGQDVVGVINTNTGQLDLYRKAAPPAAQADFNDDVEPEVPSAPAVHEDEAGERDGEPEADSAAAAALAEQKQALAAAAAAQKRRREYCAMLITHQPSNAELLKILVSHYLSGVAARSQTSAVGALLRDWDATAEGTGEKVRNAQAWHRAVAAAELHTAELKDKMWDHDAVTHLALLTERVGYEPSDWESTQLETARG